MTERCRVVLVRPSIPANIGAVARVMRNFGLSDLRLVAPHADPLEEQARKLSTHGEAILEACRSAEDLGEAVADCVMVVGTSARIGGPVRRQSVLPPWEIMPMLVEAAAGGPVALVFGPEATGLSDMEVTRCHYLLTIPADEGYPALNLDQAVAICLYELRKLIAVNERREVRETADFASQDRMFASLESALRDLHFLWGEGAEALMHGLRHLIGRARPSPMEIDLLHGLARQIRWIAQRVPNERHNSLPQ